VVACERFGMIGRLASVPLALSMICGCSSWRAVEPPPAVAAAAQKPPLHVRVTTLDGREYELSQAAVVGDSLVGTGRLLGEIPWDASAHDRAVLAAAQKLMPRALALADIRTMEMLRSDPKKTILMLAGVGLVAVIVLAAASYPVFGGGGISLE